MVRKATYCFSVKDVNQVCFTGLVYLATFPYYLRLSFAMGCSMLWTENGRFWSLNTSSLNKFIGTTPRWHYPHFGTHISSLSPSGYIANVCSSLVTWRVYKATERSVRIRSITVFELFGLFVCNRIFLYLGQFYPFLGPGPHSYEFLARKPQKGKCTNIIAPFAGTICTHGERSPIGRRVGEKNMITTTR